jgi:alkanesulfonate monooxygenase SsuD/methylene tetrahydromethanopterin reductase-like flavin-dependent oxidoreductase (luciferase family)
MGGIAPSELRRVGRLADGWLPSFITPDEAAAGRVRIEEVAAEAGRAIDNEHFGALIPYTHTEIPSRFVTAIARRRPGLDATSLVPVGLAGLRSHIEQFIAVGFSKFVLIPLGEPPDWKAELETVAEGVLDLERMAWT